MEENFSKILVEELKKLEIHAWILTPACNLAVISKESWPEQYAKKKKKKTEVCRKDWQTGSGSFQLIQLIKATN